MTKKENLLSARLRRTFPTDNVKTYIDADGYEVSEYKAPGIHIVLKSKGNSTIYNYTSHTGTNRKYISSSDIELWKLEKQMEKDLEKDFSKFPESTEFTHIEETNYTSSGCGCFGCLLVNILILVIVCVILYGLGCLGMNIIEFFKNLFF